MIGDRLKAFARYVFYRGLQTEAVVDEVYFNETFKECWPSLKEYWESMVSDEKPKRYEEVLWKIHTNYPGPKSETNLEPDYEAWFLEIVAMVHEELNLNVGDS